MIPNYGWFHVQGVMPWLVVVFVVLLGWGVWRHRRRRAAFRAGYRWALEHPSAPLHQAIMTAQGRWPLDREGQDPCLYDFLAGFHAARREGQRSIWSDADPGRLWP